MINRTLMYEANDNLLIKFNGSGIMNYTELSQDYINNFNSGGHEYWNPDEFWNHAKEKYKKELDAEFSRIYYKHSCFTENEIEEAFKQAFTNRVFNGSILEAIIIYLINNSEKYNFVDVSVEEDRRYKFDIRVEKIGTSLVTRLQVKKFKQNLSFEENENYWWNDKSIAEKYLGIPPEYIFVKFSNKYNAEREILWKNNNGDVRSIPFKNTYCRSKKYLDAFESMLDEMFDQIEQKELKRLTNVGKITKQQLAATLVF